MEIVPNPFGGVNTHLLETRPTSSVLSLTQRLSILSPDRQDVQRILRLSGVVSVKSKMKMSFSRNLVRYWR